MLFILNNNKYLNKISNIYNKWHIPHIIIALFSIIIENITPFIMLKVKVKVFKVGQS